MPLLNARSSVRTDFPALERLIDRRPAVFLDGPAGSQVPRSVIDAVSDYLVNHNANTGGDFASSRETGEMMERARARAASLVGASDPREIVFGANMTTLTFALSRALGATWNEGDEIVVTQLDHQANIEPWRRAAEEAGAVVRTVPFDPESCTLDMSALSSMIGARTKLLAIGWASNALGTINDVRTATELAHAAGALTFVDAVHYAPHAVMDVQSVGCDFLACSAYKFFGPHVGLLWGRGELLRDFGPYKLPPASDEYPGRWETGTLNHEGIAGTAAAIEWIAGLARSSGIGAGAGDDWRNRITQGMETIEALERPVFQRLLSGLNGMPGVRVHGPGDGSPRTPTVSFTMDRLPANEISSRLAQRGIFVWAGDFYAPNVIDRLELRERGGAVRVGLAPYNTAEEIDRLLDALDAM